MPRDVAMINKMDMLENEFMLFLNTENFKEIHERFWPLKIFPELYVIARKQNFWLNIVVSKKCELQKWSKKSPLHSKWKSQLQLIPFEGKAKERE